MSGTDKISPQESTSLKIEPVAPSHQPDKRANAEEAAFASGADLEDAKTRRQIDALGHEGRLEGHVFSLVKWFLTFVVILLGISVSVIAFHMLAPPQWRWLQNQEISELRNFLFSGAVGAALTFVARFVFRQSDST